MGSTESDLLTEADIRRLRMFVRQSKDIPQLVKARMYAICILSNIGDEKVPALGPKEFIEFMKLSPLYTGGKNAIRRDNLRDKRELLTEATSAA